MRDCHLDRYHRVDEPRKPVASDSISIDEMVPLLAELIRANKVDEGSLIKKLVSRLSRYEKEFPIKEAASCGSSQMMELLWSPCVSESNFFTYIVFSLEAALKSHNYDILKWVAARSKSKIKNMAVPDWAGYYPGVWNALLQSDDPETLYRDYVEDTLLCLLPGKKRISQEIWRGFVEPTNGEFQKEKILICLWTKLRDGLKVDRSSWSKALNVTAETTCSVKLADVLLRYGARIHYDSALQPFPPLLHAAKKDTLESAKFLRLLLYHGADPECNERPSVSMKWKVSEMKGPRGIHKWLKISWEELVEEAKEARRVNENPPVPED
jgi:hypothetical protein